MIEFRTLGTLDLRDPADDRGIGALLAQPKRVAFLAYLAASPARHFHHRDTLIGLFWPESTESRARHSFSQTMYQLRRALGREAIVTRGGNELALADEPLWCDTRAFAAALAAGRREEALELYRGDFLAGFHLPGNIEFEQWLTTERARLREMAVAAARAVAGERQAGGDLLDATRWLRLAGRWAPYNEELLRELLVLLQHQGDRIGALREYDAFAKRVARDLELEPSAATTAVVERIRIATAPPVPPPGDATDAPSAGTLDRGAVHAQATARGAQHSDAPAAAVRPRYPATPRDRRRGPRRLLAAIAVLVLVGVVAVGGGLRSGQQTVSEPVAFRLAVLPFEVQGADRFAYLGEGLAVLLSAQLDGAGPLRSIDPRAVLNYLDPTERRAESSIGQRVAAHFGAERFLLGSVIEAGGRLAIHAAIYDAMGTLRSKALTVTGVEEELFALVDEIARDLIVSGYDDEPDRLLRLAARTTTSMPALKAYLDGERAYRMGRFAEATAAFEHAARADSTFALAHYRLGLAMLWANVADTLPFDPDARALRHSGRLAEHDRRMIEAYGAWRNGAADDAERIYRNLAALRPHDVEVWHQLGETLFHYNPLRGRSIAEAREPFGRVLQLAPRHWGAMWHLALVAATEGDWEDFGNLTDRLLALEPDSAHALELRVLRTFARGDTAAERRLAPTLHATHGLQLSDMAWRVAVHLQNLDGALRLTRLLTTPERLQTPPHFGWESLVYLQLARGRLREAAEEIAALAQADRSGIRALEIRAFAALLPPRPPPLHELVILQREVEGWWPDTPARALARTHLAGVLSAALGDTIGALNHAARLAEHAGALGQEQPFHAFAGTLRAQVARHGGRADEALHLLTRSQAHLWFGWAASSPIQSQARDRYLRAELLRELGRFEEALGWYTSFEEHAVHDLPFLAPSHLRRAEIYEHLGDAAAATKHYQRFLALWADADAELASFVEQARQRLAALQAGT